MLHQKVEGKKIHKTYIPIKHFYNVTNTERFVHSYIFHALFLYSAFISTFFSFLLPTQTRKLKKFFEIKKKEEKT